MTNYQNYKTKNDEISLSNNEELQDNEFYSKDFTIASDMEEFTAHIEDIFNQWQLTRLIQNEENNKNLWNIKSYKLIRPNIILKFTFCEKLNISHEECDNHPFELQLVDNDKEFSDEFNNNMEEDLLRLSNWYGLKYFVVISNKNEEDEIMSENLVRIILSCTTIVMKDLHLKIPIFIEIKEKDIFTGVYEANGIRTNFDIIQLKQGPYNYLNEILNLFKENIDSHPIDDITISYQTTYIVEDFNDLEFTQDFPDVFFDTYVEHMFSIPLGICIEPIEHIIVKFQWNTLSVHSITDTKPWSTFNPIRAPIWKCSIEINPKATSYCFLTQTLREISVETSSNRNWHNRFDEEALFKFLFPDKEENFLYAYKENGNDKLNESQKIKIDTLCKNIKSCQRDSLVYRFSIVLLNYLRQRKSIEWFWINFVKRIRMHWYETKIIAGLGSNIPDLKTSLLNQKLQLLNYCITLKQSSKNSISLDSSDDEDEEEFFDATEDFTANKPIFFSNKPMGRLSKMDGIKLIKTGEDLYIPITQMVAIKTEDQVEADADLFLKLGSDPEASGIKTKILGDTLLSDMQAFKAANPCCLLEDFIRWYSPRDWIENENDELDEYGQKKGTLSKRFQIPNNPWLEMWDSARPIPADKQIKLFDYIKEGENILKFLSSLTMPQVLDLVLPVTLHAIIVHLYGTIESLLSTVPEGNDRLSNLIKNAQIFSHTDYNLRLKSQSLTAFIEQLETLEMDISVIKSLHRKLNLSTESQVVDKNLTEVNRLIGSMILYKSTDYLKPLFLGDMVTGKQVHINDISIKKQIAQLITEPLPQPEIDYETVETEEHQILNNSAFPSLSNEKEYVLKTDCNRPNVTSSKCPQFLRVIINSDKCRLVGAFSEDTTFF